MSVWKISNGGYTRFDKSTSKYVLVNIEKENCLDSFLKQNFCVNLNEINKLIIIDEYTHHSVTISKKNNEKIEHTYGENELPDILRFYSNNYHNYIDENDINNYKVTLLISQGSTY